MSNKAMTFEQVWERFNDALKVAIDDVKTGKDIRVRISNSNSKMGAVASVSTLPLITCPSCCIKTCGKKCYAKKLALLRPSVLRSYAINTAMSLCNPMEYWNQVSKAAGAFRYFRFHVSGDIIDDVYFSMMIGVAQENPNTQFLCFTKRYSIVNKYIENHGALPSNLHILFSGWQGLKPDNPYNLPETNVFTCEDDFNDDWKVCGGNCFNCACRGVGCWQAQAGDTIAFKIH